MLLNLLQKAQNGAHNEDVERDDHYIGKYGPVALEYIY